MGRKDKLSVDYSVPSIERSYDANTLTEKPGEAAHTPPLRPRMAACEIEPVPRSWLSMYPCQDMSPRDIWVREGRI